jgi:hypothetical protein
MCVSTVAFQNEGKAQEKVIKTVKASDLIKKVTVIGELGHPLGEVVTIRGKWRNDLDKGGEGSCFVVTHVNGRKLDREVKFWEPHVLPWKERYKGTGMDPIRPSTGEVWDLSGFESGILQGLSNSALKELGLFRDNRRLVQGPDYEFIPEFRYMKVKLSGRD